MTTCACPYKGRVHQHYAWCEFSAAARRNRPGHRRTAMPEYAGLVQWRRSRQTGYYVGIYNGEEAGMDTDAGKWQTVCEEHGTVISHTTLARARAHSREPLEWCEPCDEMYRGPRAEMGAAK